MGLEAAEKLNATNDMNRDTAQLHVGVLRSWQQIENEKTQSGCFLWQDLIRGLSKLDYDSAEKDISYFPLVCFEHGTTFQGL